MKQEGGIGVLPYSIFLSLIPISKMSSLFRQGSKLMNNLFLMVIFQKLSEELKTYTHHYLPYFIIILTIIFIKIMLPIPQVYKVAKVLCF